MHGDLAIARLAARQHGVVTVEQLRAAGVDRRAVAHRLDRGRLTRLHRGVYLVGPLKAQFTRPLAAVLACGPRAVLSHAAAAALWGFMPPAPGAVDVTVAGGDRRSRAGIRVHRVRHLDASDLGRHAGIPVTSPARTLLDLATVLPLRDLERVVEEAQVLRHVTAAELERAVTTARAGAAALRAALAVEPALTRSQAETELLSLIRAARLPPPAANARVAGYEVDLLWPDRRLVVEVDGFAYHGSRRAFERDRLRDAELQAAGYRVVRVTWRQIADRYALVARLARLTSAPAGRAERAARARRPPSAP